MAQEKVVEVTVDRDLAAAPASALLRQDRADGRADAGDHLPQGPGQCRRGARGAAARRARHRRRLDPRGRSRGRVPEPHPRDGHGWLSQHLRRPHHRLRRGRADARRSTSPQRFKVAVLAKGAGRDRLGAGRDRRGARARRHVREPYRGHDDRRRRPQRPRDGRVRRRERAGGDRAAGRARRARSTATATATAGT